MVTLEESQQLDGGWGASRGTNFKVDGKIYSSIFLTMKIDGIEVPQGLLINYTT